MKKFVYLYLLFLSVCVKAQMPIAAVNATSSVGRAAWNSHILPSAPNGNSLTKVGRVVGLGAPGSFSETMVEGGSVIFDSAVNHYMMGAVGYSNTGDSLLAQIGFYYSDNVIDWRFSGLPIFGPSGIPGSPDEKGVTGGVLYKRRGVDTLYLLYIGLTQRGYEGGVKTMCLATSVDNGQTWTRWGAIISPEPTKPWRDEAIWHPSQPLQIGNTYYIFFNADGGVGNETIGYATSTDLHNWVVADANSPVLIAGTGWDSAFIGDPSVYQIGTTVYMAFYGTDGVAAYDGVATTSIDDFPLGWVKSGSNPLLSPTAGTYDGKYAHKPNIFVTPFALYHFYTAVDESDTRTIALAIQYF